MNENCIRPGCYVKDYGQGHLFIKYCVRHAAAPAMYEALIYARDEMVVKTDGEDGAYHAIEAALALADGESDDGEI
jgi:hypothetical protein